MWWIIAGVLVAGALFVGWCIFALSGDLSQAEEDRYGDAGRRS